MISVPLGLLISVLILSFLFSFINETKVNSFIVSLGIHYSGVIYPGVILVLFFFILVLFLNLYSLVPMSFSYTSLPMVTLGFGVVMWGGGYMYCLLMNYESCVAHFLPLSTPQVLQVVLVWIEILSWLCRPLALGVRLMANITAGHLLLLLISQSVFYVSYLSLVISLVLVSLVLLEVGVGVIQSYVYTLLLSLYINEGLE